MENTSPHIMIIAGEASGDLHAAHLVDAIKQRRPQITFSGLGGPHMRQSGVHLYADITRWAIIGFTEVIRHYGHIKRLFDLMIKKTEEIRPAAVILVDYPGFNLRLAKRLKSKGHKVIYYISPQVWAWKEKRVETIREVTDKMLVLFAFEKDFYARRGVDVTCVGHPLVDRIPSSIPSAQARSTLGLSSQGPVIGILPGSRTREIETLLPPMLEAAGLIKKKIQDAQFVLIQAPTIGHETLEKYKRLSPVPLTLVPYEDYQGLQACDACMVASGTATLETALLQKPMVVVYKTSFLTWVLAKLFIKIPCIGLVNVVAREKIVPECVQFQAKGKNIAQALLPFLLSDDQRALVISRLGEVKGSLGPGGASGRAADEVLKII